MQLDSSQADFCTGDVLSSSEHVGHALPRLTLVSDTPLFANSFGLCRTLSNIFANYPSNRLIQLAPLTQSERGKPLSSQRLTFEECIPNIKKRFAAPLNGVIDYLNQSLIASKARQISLHSDVVIISGSTINTLLCGYEAAKVNGLPFLIYLMDDLRALDSKKWWGSSGDKLLHKILSEASGWLMISPELAKIYSERYSQTPKSLLIVHNPVPRGLFCSSSYSPSEALSLAYAGSVWGMHRDALLVLINAVAGMVANGYSIELVIYTSENAWKDLAKIIPQQGIRYAGEIAYNSLHATLAQHHILCVASSFNREFNYLSQSSVQTKLTDYMASGRAVLSLGPQGSACHRFVREWECGYVIESEHQKTVMEELRALLTDHDRHERLGRRGFEIALEHFSTEVVEKTVCTSLITLTADHLAFGFSVAALVCFSEGALLTTSTLCALAALTKETHLLTALSIGAILFCRGMPAKATTHLLISTIPLCAWILYVSMHAPVPSFIDIQGNINTPFSGLVKSATFWPLESRQDKIFHLGVLFSFLICTWRLMRYRQLNYLLLTLPWILLLLCADSKVWDLGNNIVRTSIFLYFLAFAPSSPHYS